MKRKKKRVVLHRHCDCETLRALLMFTVLLFARLCVQDNCHCHCYWINNMQHTNINVLLTLLLV